MDARLRRWRRDVATAILRGGMTRDPEIITAAAQRILDRILFLRLCEERGLEAPGTLAAMASDEDGFWARFMTAHDRRYRDAYDGVFFPCHDEDDPVGLEPQWQAWRLAGPVFRELAEAAVVPLETFGGLYEQSLGKRLRVVGDDVEEEPASDPRRAQGATYTPAWVVRRVVAATLGPLTRELSPDAILGLRVLDPACGAGAFLLGVCDHLEGAILTWAGANPGAAKRSDIVRYAGDRWRLTPAASRPLIACVHGIDIDPNAVEIARMALAFRHLDPIGAATSMRACPLAGIGRNLRQGNFLVGERDAVTAEGGFHAVVGNPPYVEVKRYRASMPATYAHLKGGAYVTADQGKTDLAVPFMEKGVKLLRPGGRLGFIIQSRFFKTRYGGPARRWLRDKALLESVDDFGALPIFPGRTTYTAVMVLQAGGDSFQYRVYDTLASARAARPVLDQRVTTARLDDGPWSLDQPDLLAVHAALAKRHGTIGEHRELELCVGLQTLYGEIYQLRAVAVGAHTVRARNGAGDEVVVERKALRPLCRNRGFYPLRADNADAWVIFPYDVEGGRARAIAWREFESRFPQASSYLQRSRPLLERAVAMERGPERWHLYRYPKNLVQQARPKVLFPSTIEDVVAAVDADGDVYQDNVRICSLHPGGLDLYAVAAVMNSSVFNALALAKAGLSDGGWRQLNRQFAELVPFPMQALRQPETARRLAELALHIRDQQVAMLAAPGDVAAARRKLSASWGELDDAVETLYGLTTDQRRVIARYPRRIDRVDHALRNQLDAGLEPGGGLGGARGAGDRQVRAVDVGVVAAHARAKRIRAVRP